jgi:two-component system, LytTR family, response regulator
MRAIIIDDEINSIKALSMLLKKCCPDLTAITECPTAQQGIDTLRRLNSGEDNLVLLDIEMPFMNGFELLQQIQEVNFELIFITAYNQYAIDAFKFNAVDYLLKPVSAIDLSAAIRRVMQRMSKKLSLDQIAQLLASVQPPSAPRPRHPAKIALPSLDGIQYFSPDEIVRCEAKNNYSLFIFKTHAPLLVSRNLREYEDMLTPHHFLRVHKSHLVNLQYVRKYLRGEGGQLIMEDGATVDVARNRKEEVLQRLAGR